MSDTPNHENTHPHIYDAMGKVMKAVTHVPRDGQYGHPGARAGNYKYLQLEDLQNRVGAAFRSAGVVLQAEELRFEREKIANKNGGEIQSTLVKMRYLFTSTVDGSTVKFEATGEGRDYADKSTKKAYGMALKTALEQALCLPTDEIDPDSERIGDPNIETTSTPPAPTPVPSATVEEIATALDAPNVSLATVRNIWATAKQYDLLNTAIPDAGCTVNDRIQAVVSTLQVA